MVTKPPRVMVARKVGPSGTTECRSLSVAAPGDTTAPTVAITAPASGASITEATDITGTVSDAGGCREDGGCPVAWAVTAAATLITSSAATQCQCHHGCGAGLDAQPPIAANGQILFDDQPVAEWLAPRLIDAGACMITIHGRTTAGASRRSTTKASSR